MKIAIVGTGISGLSAAHLLAPAHDLTVFEAAERIGGHTHTVVVREAGRTLSIDTGFIVFNRENYPRLWRLFERLGVASRDSDMSFSVHCERCGLEYNGASLAKIFAQRRNLCNPSFLRMLGEILAFGKQSRASLRRGLDDTVTVTDYTKTHGYSDYFTRHYLLPLGASLWSCPARRFARFPARFVLEFLQNHAMLQLRDRPVWKTVRGGSHRYIEKLIRPFASRVLTRAKVTAVARRRGGVSVQLADGRRDEFDEVIMACHADESLRLLRQADTDEREILGCFKYQTNEAVLHTDTAVLPRRPSAWASWNYRIAAADSSDEDSELAQVSYNMNKLQGLESERVYCVSLNQAERIHPRHVIRRIRYRHPVFAPGRDHAQRQHARLIRRRGVSYCGAYWGYGFHEDGVKSGYAVAAAFGRAAE